MATMQNMTIDTQEMMTIARNFGSEINEWDSLVKRIWAALGEFDGMWEGDAPEEHLQTTDFEHRKGKLL